jgi:hypothetical protein
MVNNERLEDRGMRRDTRREYGCRWRYAFRDGVRRDELKPVVSFDMDEEGRLRLGERE